ncbi:MFS transporter [Massilia phosphatilytica]|nr:MFS transporter [Massilia phosphatilytica]
MTTTRWLFALQLVAMGAMEMSGPFWLLHLRRLGDLSPHALAWVSGLAYAGPMAMAMCTTPWWGRLGDRVGHKPMLLRALLALAATQWWIAATDSVAVILLVRLLQGALAGYIAAAQAYGARLVAREARGALMAQLQVATAIGSVAGPVLGGWLFDAWGFASVNVWAGAACLLCAALAAIVLPPVAPLSTQPAGPRSDKAPLPAGVAGLLLGIVLVQAGKMMPQTFFGLYADDVLHVSNRVTGLCYAGTALGLCVAAPFWARRFARLARAGVLAHVEWILWACVAIVAVQALATNVVLFVLARVLWGVCLAALLPVFYGLLSREADDTQQGRVLGAGNGAAKAGALAGAGAGGLALAWVPLSAMFWTVALLYAVAAVGMRAIRTTRYHTIQTTTGIS